MAGSSSEYVLAHNDVGDERPPADQPVPVQTDHEKIFMLITFELDHDSILYDIKSLLYAFRQIVGLKLEKELFEGYAIAKYGVYDLAWLGITPFARELTKWHTHETYYQE